MVFFVSTILGINAGHNSSISIVRNGQLIGFCSSENLTGVKNQGAIFGAHIERLLSEASLTISDIDYIGIASTQFREVLSGDGFPATISFVCNGLNLEVDHSFIERNSSLYYSYIVMNAFANGEKSNPHFAQFPQLLELYRKGGWPAFFSRNIAGYIAEVKNYRDYYPFSASKLNDEIRNRCLYPIKMTLLGKTISGFFVSHHLAHSYSAYAKSPFTDCRPSLIVTADGGGWGPEGNMISVVLEGKIYTLGSSEIFDGGPFYQASGYFLGLLPGKFMGLSGHGIPDLKIVDKFLDIRKKSISKGNAELLKNIYVEKHGNLPESLDPSNPKPISIAANYAATVQSVFCSLWESFILDSQILAEKICGFSINNICLSGGVALNCPGNEFVQTRHPGLNIFIDPSCNDEGLSLGAAFASLDACKVKHNKVSLTNKGNVLSRCNEPFNPFCGQAIDNEELLPSLCLAKGYSIEKFDDQWDLVCMKLIAGKIGLLMRGNYEIGPRALGNRSIIALAQIHDNHQKVNSLKEREQWRPLAPAVLESDFNTYFEGVKNPYMLCTNRVKNPNLLPAVTHSDGSARVQCVLPIHRNFSSLLASLHSFLPEINPVIMNTSLNGKKQPMINDCVEMFAILKRQECDFAITDNYFISKN